MAKYRRPAYSKYATYHTRAAVYREAAVLRKSGRYNAQVRPNTGPSKRYFPWALWTQRLHDRP